VRLAEALALRADAARQVEQLRVRIVANARFQEGEEPAEDAGALLAEAGVVLDELEGLIRRINPRSSLLSLRYRESPARGPRPRLSPVGLPTRQKPSPESWTPAGAHGGYKPAGPPFHPAELWVCRHYRLDAGGIGSRATRFVPVQVKRTVSVPPLGQHRGLPGA
jgi:hypothetical protein